MLSHMKAGDSFKVDVYDRKDSLVAPLVEVTVVDLPTFKNSGISFPCGSSGPWVVYKGRYYCVDGEYSITV